MTTIKDSFRNLSPQDLSEIIKLNNTYGSEISLFNDNKKCNEKQVLRFYKNLIEFTNNYQHQHKIININEPRILRVLIESGYIANLLNKMFEMAYKIYKSAPNVLESITDETIKYHNDLVAYYLIPPPFTIELTGNIDIVANQEALKQLCTNTDILYIIVSKKTKFFDLNATFFATDTQKTKSKNLLKPYMCTSSILSQYEKNIWYIDKTPISLRANDNDPYSNTKQNKHLSSFYNMLDNGDIYGALSSLYSITLDDDKFLSGMKNFQYLYKTFKQVKQEDVPGKINKEQIPYLFPNVQIVTIIQTDTTNAI